MEFTAAAAKACRVFTAVSAVASQFGATFIAKRQENKNATLIMPRHVWTDDDASYVVAACSAIEVNECSNVSFFLFFAIGFLGLSSSSTKFPH